MKDVETTSLKKLFRNLTNIFTMKLEDVDPYLIRNKLFSTLVKTNNNKTMNNTK